MITKELMQAGNRFKRSKIWKYFRDNELFAMDLPSDQRGYFCIMGFEGKHTALGVYLGEEGLASYMRILCNSVENKTTGLEPYGQLCLQCSCISPDYLTDEMLQDHMDYRRSLGLDPNLNGYDEVISFESFRPFCPTVPVNQEEHDDLIAALNLVDYIAKALSQYNYSPYAKSLIGFTCESAYSARKIPLFKKKGKKYTMEMIPLRQDYPNIVPTPELPKQHFIDYFASLPADPDYDMNVSLHLWRKPMFNEEFVRYYPLTIFIEWRNTKKIEFFSVDGPDPQCWSRLLKSFLYLIREHKPRHVYAMDNLTYRYLKEACGKIGIELSIDHNMRNLKKKIEYYDNSNEPMADPEFVYSVKSIRNMSDEELASLPSETILFLNNYYDLFPEDIKKRIKKFIS